MPKLPTPYKTARLMAGTVDVIEQEFPNKAFATDVLVIKPSFIGICRADVKEVANSRDIMKDQGPLFGHELVGTIVFAGSQTGFREGSLVTFNPNITPNRTTGFAEYIIIQGSPEELEQAVVPVAEPDILDHIWMPEPFACVVHSMKKLLELSELTSLEGKKVGIIGAGCSGLMFAMYAKHFGASVTVFNRGEMRRSFAIKQAILTQAEARPIEELADYKNAFDAVLLAPTVITEEILESVAGTATENGIIHLYGGTRKGDFFPATEVDIDSVRRQERIEPLTYQSRKLYVSGAYGCLRKDYQEGFRLHSKHAADFPLEKLISKQISLDEFPELVMAIAAGKNDYAGKVLIRL